MNYIITKNIPHFKKVGEYNYISLEEMVLPDLLAVDTETTGLHARKCDLFCIQIGTGKNNYIIDLYSSKDCYTFYDVIPYLEGKTMIFHNAAFDLGFCYKYNFYPENVRDTMLANRIIYNGVTIPFTSKKGKTVQIPIKNGFGDLMKKELGVIYDKTTQKNIHLVKLSKPTTIEYSFNDVDKLIELHDDLLLKLEKNGSMPTYNLHCRYIRALAYMEQCGLPINTKKWEAKMKVDLKNTLEWKKVVTEYIYDHTTFGSTQLGFFGVEKDIVLSVNSPKQMIKVFNELGINTKDKDGKDSINEKIISKSKHEFVPMWLKFQNANHRVTTFGDKILQKVEKNRIYSSFNPMVDTSRLSSRRGSINFLNFPSDEETRSCFECSDDNIMIVCDWSGQETVIAADVSGDKAMTASVVEGADLHSAFARVLFPEVKDLSDEEISTKHKDKRTASKAPRFCFQYGGNAFTLHTNDGIPMKRAQEIENAFKELHSDLFEWGIKKFQESLSNKYISSTDGWRLALPEYKNYKKHEKVVKAMTRNDWSMYKRGKEEAKKYEDAKEKDEVYKIVLQESFDFYKKKKRDVKHYFILQAKYQRLCLNSPIQTIGSHQLKLAKSMLFDWILENNYQNVVKIVNSVHDEIILECPKELGEIVRLKTQECMIAGGNHYLKNLTIKADAHLGKNWWEAK